MASAIDDQRAVEPAADVPRDEPEDHPGEYRQQDGDDDHQQGGLRAPDRAGEHVVPTDGRPEKVHRVRWLLRPEELAVRTAQLVEPVRRDVLGEDRDEDEDGRDHQTGDEHPPLQPDALPQLVDDGESPEELARASLAGHQ